MPVLHCLVKHGLHVLVVRHFYALIIVKKSNLVLKILLKILFRVSLVLLPRLGLGLIVLEIALASRVSVHVVRWEFLGMLVLFHVRSPQCLYILVLLDCGRNFSYSGALVCGKSLVICHCADPLGLGLLRRDLMDVMVVSGCHDPWAVTLDSDRLRLHWLHHVAQTD